MLTAGLVAVEKPLRVPDAAGLPVVLHRSRRRRRAHRRAGRVIGPREHPHPGSAGTRRRRRRLRRLLHRVPGDRTAHRCRPRLPLRLGQLVDDRDRGRPARRGHRHGGRTSPKLGLPRLDRGGRTRTEGSMVLFGMSYAIASLGCTVGLVPGGVVRGTAEQSNLASGVAAFGAYAAGMSVVLMALSLALAFAREGLVLGMRSMLRYFDRVAGGLLVVVGIYLVSYGTVAIRDDSSSTSPITFVDNLSASLQTWTRRSRHRSGSRARHRRAGRVGLVASSCATPVPTPRPDLKPRRDGARAHRRGAAVPSDHGRGHRDPPPVGDQVRFPGSTSPMPSGRSSLRAAVEGTLTALCGTLRLREDHHAQDDQPAHRADLRHDRAVRSGHPLVARPRAAPGHRVRDPTGMPLSRT